MCKSTLNPGQVKCIIIQNDTAYPAGARHESSYLLEVHQAAIEIEEEYYITGKEKRLL